ITRKRQHFFKLVDTTHERDQFIDALVASNMPLQMKYTVIKDPEAKLTQVKPYQYGGHRIYATHDKGPRLEEVGKVTVFFEANKSKLFAAADLAFIQNGSYSVHINKLYELQRRNAFR